MTTKTAIISLVVAVVLIASFAAWNATRPQSYSQINSYDECVAAGYPIMESYPEQCRLPDGRTFVNKIQNTGTGAATSSAPDTSGTANLAPFDKPLTFRVGTKMVFADGLTATLKELNDSRCKPGVQCIWAGEISAVFAVSRAGYGSEELRLGTATKKTTAFGGHSFTLQSATPETATIVVSSAKPASGSITGYLHLGPTCPVERDPPDPGCGDRPYADATVNIKSKASGAIIAAVKSDASGNFRATLAPGTYLIEVSIPSVLPTCESKEATVPSGGTVSVDISCDTGIR